MEKTNLSEPQKIIADITLMNNCFMNKVFASDVKSTQLLLRIILNNDKIKVKTVNTQQLSKISMVIRHSWIYWQQTKTADVSMSKSSVMTKAHQLKERVITAASLMYIFWIQERSTIN